MKRLFLSITMLAFFLSMQAQLLWKISGNDQEKTSYIIGTHHLSAFSIMDSIKGLNEAFNSAEQVYGEVLMSEMMSSEFIIKAQTAMFITEDITLADLYSEDEFAFINNFTTQNLNLDLTTVISMKPAALQIGIVEYIHSNYTTNHNPEEQLDFYFQNKAIEENKKVGGLESVDFQLDIFFNSPLERQAEQLLCIINEIDESIAKIQDLNEAYLKQDIEYILKLSEETNNSSCDSTKEEMADLNQNRNKNWAKIMPDIMKERATFFAVGALHLPGEEGILNLLRQQGFTVEAVN